MNSIVHFAIAAAIWYAYTMREYSPVVENAKAPGPGPASALELVPELNSVAQRVVAAAPPNQDMNARAVAGLIEKFARVYYRAGGKLEMSPCEKTRILGDLAHARAEAVDAIHELFFASRREKHRKTLDELEIQLIHHTDAAIRVVRRALGNPNAYTPGRGFPEGVEG